MAVRPRRTPRPALAPKKRPRQARSRATVDALVDAATWLLPRRGYAGTTTNHIAARAGVNVASLYEYFPGKDAIVAQVAERLVERVLGGLVAGLPGLTQRTPADQTRAWIELVHGTVARERGLVAVFLHEIPYTRSIAAIRSLPPRLMAFSRELRRVSGDQVRADLTAAGLQLLVNLVVSTILQVVLDPPRDVSRARLLDELAVRMDAWVRPSVAPRP